MPKPCEACQSSAALIFCRADSAYLCLACDGKVHGANKLASRHERVWVCEVCEMSPAAVTCKADAAALCATCDADIHEANPLANRHERVPVVPFFSARTSATIRYASRKAYAESRPRVKGRFAKRTDMAEGGAGSPAAFSAAVNGVNGVDACGSFEDVEGEQFKMEEGVACDLDFALADAPFTMIPAFL
ncbi:unnamed protein product [Closterium sp. NIES-54]